MDVPQQPAKAASRCGGVAACLLVAALAVWGGAASPALTGPSICRADAAAQPGGDAVLVPYTALSAIMSPLWVAVDEDARGACLRSYSNGCPNFPREATSESALRCFFLFPGACAR